MSTGEIVAASLDDQSDGLASPTEQLCYTNSGATQTYGIGIVLFSAATTPFDPATNPRFDLFYTGTSSLQFQTAAGSVAEPASSPAALAVGADCWQSGAVEFYSSQGPTIHGRTKPDLVAPDGVSTSTLGNAGATCGQSGFLERLRHRPRSPALLQSCSDAIHCLSPATLEAGLEQTSMFSDSSLTGPTNSLGHGRLRLGAVAALPATIIAARIPYGIYSMAADGSEVTRIPLVGAADPLSYASPAWSPTAR